MFWNSNAAIKVTVLSGDAGTGYGDVLYGGPDGARRLNNKFLGSSSVCIYLRQTVLTISLRFCWPDDKVVRVNVLYESSSVAVQPKPDGSTLASQRVLIKATGTAQNNVVTNLIFSKDSERVPVIFENVLFTNLSLTQ
jgi:hypothetical protein